VTKQSSTHLFDFLSCVAPEDREHLINTFVEASATGPEYADELLHRVRDLLREEGTWAALTPDEEGLRRSQRLRDLLTKHADAAAIFAEQTLWGGR
jgi:hypothetical protein